MAKDDPTSPSTGTRIAGLLVVLMGFWFFTQQVPFSRRGTYAQAHVTGFHTSSGRRGSHYYPTYELMGSFKSNTCVASSSSWFWSKPQVGDVVSVIYYFDGYDRLVCDSGGFLDRWLSTLLAVLVGATVAVRGKS
jgi:hypothetical protein